ncbi:TonB-dependent receptor [Ensifer adhaerens]|uniref:TonB-dependent receptor plug domain-containing protein n=1 Tax=Ensifer canadensis TaxID=555315 RepID=UPI00148F6906|nr:TonB-dependent receptor [Ensifer canadensis]NOV20205.1 TonB-dependent receptor [Ensifer canadensis]
MRNFLGGALVLAVAVWQPMYASNPARAEELTELEEIVVTDGLTSIELEKSGRAITVISGDDMEKNQIRYVSDALRLVPGVAVSRTGSYGGMTQIRVRGAEGNQVLVAIDGVTANDVGQGEFDFGSLVADDIERIEVLRGPQSTFWGANAMSGVINIVTRRGERGAVRSRARTEVGSDGSVSSALSARGGGEAYDYSLSGSFAETEGFNISSAGGEDDGGRNGTLNGNFKIDLSPDTTMDATLRGVSRRSDSDPQAVDAAMTYDAGDYTKNREFDGSVGITSLLLDDALTQKMLFSGNDIYHFRHSEEYGNSSDDGNRYDASYQTSFRLDDADNVIHQLTAGYEWQRETFAPSHLAETFSRDASSLIGEYRGEFFDQLYLNLGARHDWNNGFEDAGTWTASAAWQVPSRDLRLHASVGTGVTDPTFYEQFGYFPGGFIGNPNLQPERSLGYDIGVEKSLSDGSLVVDVTYFNQNLENEITTVYDADFLARPINNDGESRRQGVEISATLDFFNGVTMAASYTYTDATEQAVASGPRLVEVRRPRHVGSLKAAYVFFDDRARVYAEAVFNGRTVDTVFASDVPPRVTLAGYSLVNVGSSLKINDTLEMFGRIDNLFDRDYRDVYGFKSPGLTAFAGLTAAF